MSLAEHLDLSSMPAEKAAENSTFSTVNKTLYFHLQVVTYNGQDWGEDGKTTFGGYSDNYVCDNRYLPWQIRVREL